MLKRIEAFVRGRYYLPVVMALWVFIPEVRRIIDWRSAYHNLSLLAILPLLSLTPGIVVIAKDWAKIGIAFRRMAIVWVIAFTYSLLIGIGGHLGSSSIYAFAAFVLPMVFGLSVGASGNTDPVAAYNRLANPLLICATISAIYAIYQYAAPPPWDVYWAQSADIERSQGVTIPFNFRVFGTSNSTGPFAQLILMAMLLNFPRISLKRWYVAVAMVPMTISVALTIVRTVWIALAIGLVVYVLFAARRSTAVLSIASVLGMIALSAGLLGAAVGLQNATYVTSTLNDRIQTFSYLQYDQSANDRQFEVALALQLSSEQPMGAGLGLFGTAAKLTGGSANVLDTGFGARLVEMGWLGFVFYMSVLVMGCYYAFASYIVALRRRDYDMVDIIAVVIAVQVIGVVSDSVADSHNAFFGMFFWASIFFSSRYLAQTSESVKRRSFDPGSFNTAAA